MLTQPQGGKKTPYRIDDLLPDIGPDLRPWTIHGAFSHGTAAWEAIIAAGDAVYAEALFIAAYGSNDPSPWCRYDGRRAIYAEMAERRHLADKAERLRLSEPTSFSDDAAWLRQQELVLVTKRNENEAQC